MGYNTVIKEEKDPRFAPAITENCTLPNGFEWENSKKDGSGQMVLVANFHNPKGAVFRGVYFPVDEKREENQCSGRSHGITKTIIIDEKPVKVKKGDPITPEQAVAIAYEEWGDKVTQVLNTFLPLEEATILNAKSYEDFSKRAIEALKGKTGNQTFRLKLTLNQNSFLQLPRYGKYIEKSEVNPSKLIIKPNERVEYPEPDLEVAGGVEVTTAKVGDDLPF